MKIGEIDRSIESTGEDSRSHAVDDPRVYLAAERTFLAWVRTSISLMGFGFVIARFALWTREYRILTNGESRVGSSVSTWLGFAMVCVGVGVAILASVRHRDYIRHLEHGVTNPPLHIKTSLIVASILALVGLAIAAHILML
jgi:putative membrane protein